MPLGLKAGVRKMKRLRDYSESTRTALLILLLVGVGFLALVCFFFLGNPGVPLGFLGGGAVGLLTYLSIVYSSSTILSGDSKPGKVALSILMMLFRFIILVAVVAVAGVVTYMLESPWFNVWTVIGGYFPFPISVYVGSILTKRRAKREKRGKGGDGNA